jgi:hypothetical protein
MSLYTVSYRSLDNSFGITTNMDWMARIRFSAWQDFYLLQKFRKTLTRLLGVKWSAVNLNTPPHTLPMEVYLQLDIRFNDSLCN